MSYMYSEHCNILHPVQAHQLLLGTPDAGLCKDNCAKLLGGCRVFVGNEEWVSQQVSSSLHERQHSNSSASTSSHSYR